MAFTIRNAASAGDPQASPDKGDFDILAAGFLGDGVLSGCAVTANGTNMVLTVAPGRVRLAGNSIAVAGGTVTAASTTNPRFSVVSVNSSGTPVLTSGTAATNPVFPALLPTLVHLAAVHIPASDTSIQSTQVEDKRIMLDPGREEAWPVALSDEATNLTAGLAKTTWRAPYPLTVTKVRGSLTTASSSGVVTVNIREAGTSIFSTKLTIDASSRTSVGAAVAAVLSDTALADDAELTFDIDTAGTGAKGLKVTLYGLRV